MSGEVPPIRRSTAWEVKSPSRSLEKNSPDSPIREGALSRSPQDSVIFGRSRLQLTPRSEGGTSSRSDPGLSSPVSPRCGFANDSSDERSPRSSGSPRSLQSSISSPISSGSFTLNVSGIFPTSSPLWKVPVSPQSYNLEDLEVTPIILLQAAIRQFLCKRKVRICGTVKQIRARFSWLNTLALFMTRYGANLNTVIAAAENVGQGSDVIKKILVIIKEGSHGFIEAIQTSLAADLLLINTGNMILSRLSFIRKFDIYIKAIKGKKEFNVLSSPLDLVFQLWGYTQKIMLSTSGRNPDMRHIAAVSSICSQFARFIHHLLLELKSCRIMLGLEQQLFFATLCKKCGEFQKPLNRKGRYLEHEGPLYLNDQKRRGVLFNDLALFLATSMDGMQMQPDHWFPYKDITLKKKNSSGSQFTIFHKSEKLNISVKEGDKFEWYQALKRIVKNANINICGREYVDLVEENKRNPPDTIKNWLSVWTPAAVQSPELFSVPKPFDMGTLLEAIETFTSTFKTTKQDSGSAIFLTREFLYAMPTPLLCYDKKTYLPFFGGTKKMDDGAMIQFCKDILIAVPRHHLNFLVFLTRILHANVYKNNSVAPQDDLALLISTALGPAAIRPIFADVDYCFKVPRAVRMFSVFIKFHDRIFAEK